MQWPGGSAGLWSQPSQRIRLLAFAATTAVVGIAAVVRGLHAQRAFWIDEIVSATKFFPISPRKLLLLPFETNNHPLYSLLAHGSWKLFGEGEFQARLPSLLAWVTVLALGWTITREIFDAEAARLYVILAGFSFWQIVYATEARGYELASALLLVALYFVFEGARTGNTAKMFLGTVAAALAAYSHLFAAMGLLGAAQIWIVAILRKQRAKDVLRESLSVVGWFLLVGFLIWVLYLPMVDLATVWRGLRHGAHGGDPFAGYPRERFSLEYAKGLLGFLVTGWPVAAGAAGSLLFYAVGVGRASRSPLALSFLATPVSVICVAVGLGVVSFQRFFVVVQPFALIAAAGGIAWLVRPLGARRPGLRLVAGILVTVGSVLPGLVLNPALPWPNRPWDRVARFLSSWPDVPVATYPTGGGWSQIGDELEYYLPGRRIADVSHSGLEEGSRAFYVSIVGSPREADWELGAAPSVDLGSVRVFSMERAGGVFRPAPLPSFSSPVYEARSDQVSAPKEITPIRVQFEGDPSLGPTPSMNASGTGTIFTELFDGLRTGSSNADWECVLWTNPEPYGWFRARFLLDLGEPRLVGSVVAWTVGTYGDYRIDWMEMRSSEDGSRFTPAETVRNAEPRTAKGPYRIRAVGPQRRARYVEIALVQTAGSGTTMALSEVQVFGRGAEVSDMRAGGE